MPLSTEPLFAAPTPAFRPHVATSTLSAPWNLNTLTPILKNRKIRAKAARFDHHLSEL